ncbi:uncharacterized protein LOC124285891 isoform X3 [Haliotis rubra]|uniref:uncharacterized protein LOC124285891 isoform X3 n=1 Tax=Haliotis rubra TaxID=36100 RepID=UPI001EE5DC7C|nr:uncharacterized protein LOC124285891 isoform X3 [Haliotis rubra]
MAWIWPKTPTSSPKDKRRTTNVLHMSKENDIPFKSEQQQFDLHHVNTSTRYAPFGTENTPMFRSKIVGGKLVPVVERQVNPFLLDQYTDKGGVSPRVYPRVETLHPITDKPNNLDPAMLREYTRKLHNVNQEFNVGYNQPTSYARARPDSKDLARRYVSLPPIDHNKVKNQSSTVFEPEPWTRRFQDTSNGNSTRVQVPYDTRQNYNSGGNDGGYNAGVSGDGYNNGGTGGGYNDGGTSGRYNGGIGGYNTDSTNGGYNNDGYTGGPGGYTGGPGGYNGGTGGGYSGGPSGVIVNGRESPALYDPMPSERRDYQPEIHRRSLTLEDRKYEFLALLPKDTFLPEQPLGLTRDEEATILKMVSAELQGADPAKLKDTYLDITENYDRTLSGWCHYKNVFFSLKNSKLTFSSDLLRLIASMFVSPTKLQEVNYEKFLSFIGTSMKESNTNGLPVELYSPRSYMSTGKQGHYYTNHVDGPRPWSPRASRPSSPYYDSNVGKLLNMAEQQLQEDGIDFEGLVARFQAADREMRETLCADEIKAIVFSKGVRLQESVVNKILAKCEDPNGDGQYNWVKFVEFLEKVQPAKTGLHIPRSKKPLEYAKQVPSPVTSWPRAVENNPAVKQGALPITPLWRKDAPHGNETSLYDKETDQLKSNRQTIQQLDNNLKHLEAGYEVMKKKLASPRDDSPWFKMFMEFANALYKQDSRSSGLLPAEEVLNWTNMYNSSYNLDIPDSVITYTLSDCSQGGNVNIHKYLTKLGQRDW